jgi:hypothetical protein
VTERSNDFTLASLIFTIDPRVNLSFFKTRWERVFKKGESLLGSDIIPIELKAVNIGIIFIGE